VKKEVDEVRLVATRYVNTLTQEPVSLEFLPVGEISDARIPGVTAGSIDDIDPTEAVFEPDVESVLGYLLERYLNIYAYYVLLNAKASEQSARMVSMKNATDAAADLIRDLKLEYNKLRQGNITRELLEIAGGQAE
jgi:F-type H+-transporting ATPase subunit gamma